MKLPILIVSAALLAQPAFGHGKHHCDLKNLAGRWMFATDVGRQNLFPSSDGDITAIGIFSLDRKGKAKGSFDATVQEFMFFDDIGFEGTLVVNSDCTGTFHFVTSVGTERTDSIVVLSPWRIRAMSQDINNLWTYEMERL